MTMLVSAPDIRHSRAVLRPVQPGSTALCTGCQTPVRFAARVRQHQVIANVYVAGRWHRVEHYHPECYEQAGSPYGQAATSTPGGLVAHG